MKYNPGKRAPQPHHPLASVLLVNCNHCLWWITFHQVNTCWQQPLISHSAAHFYIIFCFLFSHFFSLSSVEAKAEQKRVDNSFFFLLPNLHSSNFPVCNKSFRNVDTLIYVRGKDTKRINCQIKPDSLCLFCLQSLHFPRIKPVKSRWQLDLWEFGPDVWFPLTVDQRVCQLIIVIVF